MKSFLAWVVLGSVIAFASGPGDNPNPLHGECKVYVKGVPFTDLNLPFPIQQPQFANPPILISSKNKAGKARAFMMNGSFDEATEMLSISLSDHDAKYTPAGGTYTVAPLISTLNVKIAPAAQYELVIGGELSPENEIRVTCITL